MELLRNLLHTIGGLTGLVAPSPILVGGDSPKFDVLPVGGVAHLPLTMAHMMPSCARRVGVHGDGSCLFHAIVAARDGAPQNRLVGHALRKEIAAVSMSDFKKGWQSYKANLHADIDLNLPTDDDAWRTKLTRFQQDMRNTTTWADLSMIPFVMYYLNVNIIFFDNETIYCDVHFYNRDRDSIFIAWVRHSHFEPILCVEEWNKNLGGYYPPHVASKVMEQYNMTCKRQLDDIFLKP